MHLLYTYFMLQISEHVWPIKHWVEENRNGTGIV